MSFMTYCNMKISMQSLGLLEPVRMILRHFAGLISLAADDAILSEAVLHSKYIFFLWNLPACSKFPDYQPATLAFQKVSYAYNILSKPTTRRAYDVNPERSREFFSGQPLAEDTFDGVLNVVLADCMKGDFEMIRTFLRTSHGLPPLCTLEHSSRCGQ